MLTVRPYAWNGAYEEVGGWSQGQVGLSMVLRGLQELQLCDHQIRLASLFQSNYCDCSVLNVTFARTMMMKMMMLLMMVVMMMIRTTDILLNNKIDMRKDNLHI